MMLPLAVVRVGLEANFERTRPARSNFSKSAGVSRETDAPVSKRSFTDRVGVTVREMYARSPENRDDCCSEIVFTWFDIGTEIQESSSLTHSSINSLETWWGAILPSADLREALIENPTRRWRWRWKQRWHLN